MTSRAYVVPVGPQRGHALSWETECELIALMYGEIGQHEEIDHGGPLYTPLGPVAVWSASAAEINEFATAIVTESTGALALVTGIAIVTGMTEDDEPTDLSDGHLAELDRASRMWERDATIDRIREEMKAAIARVDIARVFELADEFAELAPRHGALLHHVLAMKGYRRP